MSDRMRDLPQQKYDAQVAADRGQKTEMTDEQDRIRLAEWQGWIPTNRKAWKHPDGRKAFSVADLPDPKHNPADCEALINHIVERNYMFSEHRWAEDGKTVYRLVFTPRTPGDSTQGEYDDRGTGVVELALKVMDGEDNG